MKVRRYVFLLLSVLLPAFVFFADCKFTASAGFENPIKKLFNNNDVEADPNKVYLLNEKNGPWLILLCSFKDKPTDKIKDAETKANTLVHELRKKFKLKAYVFAGEFNFNLQNDLKSDTRLRSSDKSIARNKKYSNGGVFIEYVVLVGDYQSPDELQKDLEKIRDLAPECMFKMFPQAASNRRPFPMPLAVANPMLPANYISPTNNNLKFIEKLNEKREFSLLACPRKYTVQIATFTGRTVFRFRADSNTDLYQNGSKIQRELALGEKKTQLEVAEAAAEKLCKALRKKGIEAFQYHDQFSSIVTVGGFDYYNLPNNNNVLRPEIVQIMNYFRGTPVQTGHLNMPYSYIPVKIDGIECDLSPKVIEVPKGTKKL
jgi:hypothetical protein